jgi:undecaprenyl-diphosphatase
MCLYTAIAVLVLPRTRRPWRWIAVALAVVMPVGVAVSRLYRGMHHPTDLVGALLLTTLWVGLLYLVLRPNSPDDPDAAAAAGRADAHRAFDDTVDDTFAGADRDADRSDVQPAARRR